MEYDQYSFIPTRIQFDFHLAQIPLRFLLRSKSMVFINGTTLQPFFFSCLQAPRQTLLFQFHFFKITDLGLARANRFFCPAFILIICLFYHLNPDYYSIKLSRCGGKALNSFKLIKVQLSNWSRKLDDLISSNFNGYKE